MSSQNELFEALASSVEPSLLSEMILEYKTLKESHWLEDWEKSILHCAKFCEMVLAVLIYIKENKVKDINRLSFEDLYNTVLKYPKVIAEDEILSLAIPHVAHSVYTIRNKKRVAHIKAINPDMIDSAYCISACDWILAEFIMLKGNQDPERASKLIESVIQKKVPFIEEFEDGSLVILRTDLSFSENVLLVLYHFYPNRLSNQTLDRHIRAEYSQQITSNLGNLERAKLIQRNREGSVLTKLGISEVENRIIKKVVSA